MEEERFLSAAEEVVGGLEVTRSIAERWTALLRLCRMPTSAVPKGIVLMELAYLRRARSSKMKWENHKQHEIHTSSSSEL